MVCPGNRMSEKPTTTELLELTTEIVAAHAGNNTVAPADLPQLIQSVYRTLLQVGTQPLQPERPKPAVAVKRSVFPDYVICLKTARS